MNRINVNQIKQVGAFTFLYFLAIGLGVLVGNLVDHQGNMFYAPAFSALFGGTIYRYYLEKIKGVGSIFIVGVWLVILPIETFFMSLIRPLSSPSISTRYLTVEELVKVI